MPQIPIDKSLESSLALLRDPYEFISKRCQRYQAPLFQARLMFRPTVFMTGSEAAELFYDPQRFMRKRALPLPVKKTLFGEGGVQGLDDEDQRHRKQLHLSLMTPERVQQLVELTEDQWRTSAGKWASRERVVLYEEVKEILCRAVCAWAGVPLEEAFVRTRARELAVLVEGVADLKHWSARRARRRLEKWLSHLIQEIRLGRLPPPQESAAHVIARHRERNGDLLSPRIAAVELLNVLRPTVATAIFILFGALAIRQCAECRQKLKEGDNKYLEWFVQEVRRFYPFAPFLAARVRRDFDWNGYHFPRGRMVVLDVYGTNHDALIWKKPEEFRPERFQEWDGSLFNFIPQGGGDPALNHRCAGEWITIELMKVAMRFLAGRLTYVVPDQDLGFDKSKFPALPRSGFVLSEVKPADDPLY